MSKLPSIVPVTDLRQNASEVLKQAAESNEPIVITQRGRATAVLLSKQEYDRTQNEFEILRLLVKGEQEIKAEKGYDLEDVLREADDLLQEEKD